jgi:hypothetical protein
MILLAIFSTLLFIRNNTYLFNFQSIIHSASISRQNDALVDQVARTGDFAMPVSLNGFTGTAPQTDLYLPPPEVLAGFAERNGAHYQDHYKRLLQRHLGHGKAGAARRLPLRPSWSWAAFLATVPWLFYRKMYLGGIILVTLPVFLDHILPGSLFLGSGLLIAVTAGLCGKSWYVEHAVHRLSKARRDYRDWHMREAFLARAKGVSLPAGIFGALIQIVTALVVVMGLLPPNRF